MFSDIKKYFLWFFKYQDSHIYLNRKAFIKINPFRNLLWKFKRYIRTIIYKYHHSKFVKSQSISDDDIVFFLHYEPERTSNPLAGDARNQLYCIKMLRKVFPQKRIFIKEHPVQLNLKNPHQNRQIRDKRFLDELLSISDGIINKISNKSKFIVATLHGTVGLEYSLRGFNIICFGYAWYDFLQNVHNVKSSEDLMSIKFDYNNPYEIKKELEHILYIKSAKGSVSNKLEKMGQATEVVSDDSELLNYIKWYFNLS